MDKASRKRKFRTTKAVDLGEDPEEGEPAAEVPAAGAGAPVEDEEEEYEREEAARLEDIAERDALAKRMRERDAERTRKVGDGAQKKSGPASLREQAQKLDGADREDKLKALRKIARQEYLKIREEKELELLRDSIAFEEEVMATTERTEEEVKRYELNKMIYELATTRMKELDKTLVEGYRLPEAQEDEDGRYDSRKKDDLLKARYEPEEVVQTEQEIYEAHMLATAGVGGNRKKRSTKPVGVEKAADEYEFVFDDAITFIGDQIADGNLDATALLTGDGLTEAKERPEFRDEKADAAKSLAEVRKSLPIFRFRDDILAAVADNQVLVIVAETGSGKTTQVPQYLHEVGYTKLGKVGCTQPRRVAAMSVAARVSQEMGVKLGNEVGYSIRFEDCTSDDTVIKYMTDGMLLREFLTEPDMASYSCIIIDEAHERTLHTDILFGLVKDLARFREDLRILISSATMDAEKFSAYFDDCPIFTVPGRRFPVSIRWTEAPEADYLEASVIACLQIHLTMPTPGDVLVFMTGQEEIETAVESLTQRTRGMMTKMKELIVLPIYSTLPAEQQAEIFKPTPPDARKVIFGTNIAETSLTIDGIRYIVDTGFCKQKSYNPRTSMEALTVVPVSKASAVQRSGRAGRTAPGVAYRLYTKWSFKHELPDNSVPEIQRTNLSNVVLSLKALGINDLIRFDFMDPPPLETLTRSLELLYGLGALNHRGELTKLGRRMAEFPCDPMLSKMIVASEKFKCADDIISICSMLDVNNSVFYRPKDRAVHADNARANFSRGMPGDHIALLNVFNQWKDTGYSTQWCYENFVQVRSMKKARDIREQLEGLCERVEIELESCPHDMVSISKAITAGFFFHTAKLQKDGRYRTLRAPFATVSIHPSSALHKQEVPPRHILFHSIVMTTKEFARNVMAIEPQWLLEIAPHVYKQKDVDDMKKKMPKAAGKSRRDHA